MKKILLIAGVQLFCSMAEAQLKEGRVLYEQVIKGGKADFMINGESRTVARPEMITRMELLFGNDQSLKSPVEEERPEAELGSERGNTVRFAMGGGADAIVYHNFSKERRVEKRENMGKKFLITDSIHKQNWKLTGESKTILGYACQKAVSQTIAKSMRMRMTDGEMKQEETPDTINIVAWFAPAIPVPAGPDYQGQLPGLILEVAMKDGATVIRAVEISPKVTLASIKEPTGGKKVTTQQFKKEMEDSMKEMMKRGGGTFRSARPGR